MIRSSARRLAALIVSATMLFPLPAGAVTFTPVSFQVSPTGAATFELPVAVPPGTAGVSPKLSLAYSSQGGGGFAGAGLALSGLSSISRCGRTIAQDGLNSGIHYDADDRYCIDGQRLVLVSGTYGAAGSVYRSERDDFTRVVANGTAGSGPASFTASTKSGLTLQFGNTADSRIEATTSRDDVRVWALNKIRDVKGNYLTIGYAEDRTKSTWYPSRIDYTGNDVTGAATYASVRMTYDTPTDVRDLYLGGYLIRNDQRLTNVKTYVGETLVRDYRITYQYSQGDGQSLATRILECAGDGTCLPPTDLEWQLATGTPGFGAGAQYISPINPSTKAGSGDINGDGLADLIYVNGQRLYFQLSTGSGFSPAVDAGLWSFYYYQTGDSSNIALADLAVGDVNGDGLADVVAADGKVWLSTGSGLSSAGAWATFPVDGQIALGDINGDGRSDVISAPSPRSGYPYPGVVYALSTGSGFSAAQSAISSWDVNVVYPSEGPNSYYPARLGVGDVNGDGRADIVSSMGGLWLSNGAGFGARTSSGIGCDDSFFVADINGDGLADFLCKVNDIQVSFWYSNGATFAGGGGSANVTPVQALGDFNGDGRLDVFWNGSAVSLANATTPNLVSRITNGLGQRTDITYKPLSDASVYTPGSGSAWPVRDINGRAAMQVVASVAVPMASSTYVSNYAYREGRVHAYGRGFLGFKFMDTSDPQTSIKTSTEFQQDWPYVGMAKQLVKKSGSGGILNQIDNSNACLQDGVACTPQSTRYFLYVAQSDELSNDLNGAFINKVRTNNSFDAYGNALQIVVEHLTAGGTPSGYKKVTTNTYLAPDTSNWILGRLQRSTVASTAPDVSVPGNPGGVAAGDPVGAPATGISIPALITIIQTLLLD